MYFFRHSVLVLAPCLVAALLNSHPISHKKISSKSKNAKSTVRSSHSISGVIASSLGWDAARQGHFITALAGDSNGNIWVGTEDYGIWKFDRAGEVGRQWTQYTNLSGVGDDSCYALTCDRLGRIWAGTLNHGVSVYNGQNWKTYGPVTGPLGSHITAISCNPVDGDVWMASEIGLARYEFAQNRWCYYTKADGLPSNQINAIAFDNNGRLYVGSDCDGVAIGSPNDNYKTWQTISGPEEIPTRPSGDGLPSNLINCILVARDETVYVGTDEGLAYSTDHGGTWQYIRGKEWSDKVTGLSEQHTVDKSLAHGKLLNEDYVTCLAEDSDDNIWVCHRSSPAEIFNNADSQGLTKDAPRNYVQSILALKSGDILFGNYGDGLSVVTSKSHNLVTVKTLQNNYPSLPSEAQAPSASELDSMSESFKMASKRYEQECELLGEDWCTQGDWVGHYGAQYATLCAAQAPFDQNLSCWNLAYSANGQIGPHRNKDDALRHWVHWAKTDNPKSLYDPLVGYRRQSEWDDHGEAYSRTFEGPDEWIGITVPNGTYKVSLYMVNKDGHDGDNRFRDYEIEIKPFSDDINYSRQKPTIAHARVHNFWGGVYYQFAVQGPNKYYFRLAKNYSLNTLCSAIFIDKMVGPQNKWDNQPSVWLSMLDNKKILPPSVISSSVITTESARKVNDLWNSLMNPGGDSYSLISSYSVLTYRAGASNLLADSILSGWRRSLNIWSNKDHLDFLESMDQSYKRLLKRYPKLSASSR